MRKKRETDLWKDDYFIDIRSDSTPPGRSAARPKPPNRPANRPARTPDSAGGKQKRRPPPPQTAGAGRRGEPPGKKRQQRPAAREPSSIRDYDGFEEYGAPGKRSPGGPESRRSPAPPRKPQRPRESAQNPKNRRARRLMAAVTVLVMVVVTALLCVFLLFKVSEIQVTGDRVYEDAEILDLCGYKAGDNLLFVSTGDREELLKARLPYLEDVKIVRHLPGTLEIQITGAQTVSCVSGGGSWLYVSGRGKILEKKSEPKSGVMQVLGLTSLDTEPGQSIRAEEESVQSAYSAIADKLVELELAGKFTRLDLSDLYDIRLWYEDRVEFKLGSTAELAYKVEFGCSLVSDPDKIDAKARGTLDLSNADVKRATFSVNAGENSAPQTEPSGSSGETELSSSSSGGRGGEIPDALYTGGSDDSGNAGGSEEGYSDEGGGDDSDDLLGADGGGNGAEEGTDETGDDGWEEPGGEY